MADQVQVSVRGFIIIFVIIALLCGVKAMPVQISKSDVLTMPPVEIERLESEMMDDVFLPAIKTLPRDAPTSATIVGNVDNSIGFDEYSGDENTKNTSFKTYYFGGRHSFTIPEISVVGFIVLVFFASVVHYLCHLVRISPFCKSLRSSGLLQKLKYSCCMRTNEIDRLSTEVCKV